MSIPTPEELGELVYEVMREASGSIPFAPGLNALTELIGISVRDAVLEGAAQEAAAMPTQSWVCLSEPDMEDSYFSEGIGLEVGRVHGPLPDWLRSLKAEAQP